MITYEDGGARSDDPVAITIEGDVVCTYVDGRMEVVLGEGGVRHDDEDSNVL